MPAPSARASRREARPGTRSFGSAQVNEADQRNDPACRAHGDPASGPTGKTPKRNAGEVQHSGRADKTHRIGDGVRADGKLGAMRMAVKDGERSDQQRRDQSGGFAASATTVPSMTADAAIPVSTPASGMPRTPRAPAMAITSGNTTGSTQIAGAPRNAPHSPTATIAITRSGPKIGWVKPPQKSMATPLSEWAKAGVAINANASGSRPRNAFEMVRLVIGSKRAPRIVMVSSLSWS